MSATATDVTDLRPLFAQDSRARKGSGVKKGVVVLIHCGYWLVYLLLFSVILAAFGAQVRRPPMTLLPPPFSLVVLCVSPNLVSFYSFYLLLAPRFLARKK